MTCNAQRLQTIAKSGQSSLKLRLFYHSLKINVTFSFLQPLESLLKMVLLSALFVNMLNLII